MEQGVLSRGWVTDQELSSLASVQSRMVQEMKGRRILCLLYTFRSRHIVRLYSMPLLAEMPDQGRRLQRRLWACRYILWGIEHGLRLASVDPMCCR